jgi:ribulose-phosphate 3-epimerase
MFDFNLPMKNNKGKFYQYEVHLMVNDPLNWIKKRKKYIDLFEIIIIHFESFKDKNEIFEVLNFLKSKKKRIGLAINPDTSVKEIKDLIYMFDLILIMTVKPGKYGAKFLPKMLEKVKEIRKINSKVKIEVDGGMNEKTITLSRKVGVNQFVVGSKLQNASNVREVYKTLKK